MVDARDGSTQEMFDLLNRFLTWSELPDDLGSRFSGNRTGTLYQAGPGRHIGAITGTMG